MLCGCVLSQVELSFKTGDVILVFGEMDDDGFFVGEIQGRRGLVPSNFLQPMSASDIEKLKGQGHKSQRESKHSSPAKDKTPTSSPAIGASSEQVRKHNRARASAGRLR